MGGAEGGRRREMVPPPFRFGAVEGNVYRSAQPTLKNYRFLSRLKLRTVISIAPEGPMEDEAMFCRKSAAQLVPIRAELYREEAVTFTFQQVAQVLSILVNSDSLPVLVHCPDGRVLTGIVVWCLRRLQCWDNHASGAEFARYAGVLPSRDVEKFVEGFADEVIIPGNVPRWLWGGDRAHWHPAIRLRHQPPLEVFQPDPSPSQAMLRVRRGYMHAQNKLQGVAVGGAGGAMGGDDVLSGHRGIAAAASAARRGSRPVSLRMGSLRDNFRQDHEQDMSMMADDGLGLPKLSRAVQALSLEGLEMGSLDGGSYDDAAYEYHHHQRTRHRTDSRSSAIISDQGFPPRRES